MREVVGHHDFGALEARLADLIRDAKQADPAGPFAPVAVVVPTARLRTHLMVRLGERLGTLLGVHLFHHHGLAMDAAGAAAGLPREIPRRVREAILDGILREAGGDLAAYAASRPGCLSALAATMDDLRDAGVDPGAAAGAEGVTSRGAEILRIHAAYAARIVALARDGLSDRPGIRRAAIPHLPSFIRRLGFRLVVHYGAYELTGASLDLMRAVESSGVRTIYLVPAHPTSPAFEYARRFLADAPGPRVASGGSGAAAGDADRPSTSLLGSRLPILYDEDAAAPPSIDADRVQFFHAQGAASELRETALRILALNRDEGIPMREIAVVARSLEPYAPILRPVLFEQHAIPFVTSASLPALREAAASTAIRLARVALDDYPRQPLMDLLRGGLIRLGGRDPAREAHAWDRLSRAFRVSRGYTAWTESLPRWVAAREPYVPADAGDEEKERLARGRQAGIDRAAALSAAVRSLDRALRPVKEARAWRAWADAMEGTCRNLIHGFGAPPGGDGDGAVLDVLSEMRAMEAAGIAFGSGRALRAFERGLLEAMIRIPPAGDEPGARGRDNGGVRVLDAMQARGLTFDAVFLIGFNADLFPARPREDAFLRDADRRILRERLGAPVPIKSGRREEEHLLLAHVLGSARRRLTVSWQRADESGRARVASLALREVARVTLGAGDLRRAEEAAHRVPAHPLEAARDAARRFGILPPGEARIAAALQVGSSGALLAASGALPVLPGGDDDASVRAGLGMLSVVEEFSPADLRYDAFVGDAAPAPAEWSPSRLETLGNCPQQYFFRHVLRVEELEEAEEGYALDAGEAGLRAHAILKDIYQELLRTDLLSSPGADPARAVRRALDLVDEAWARHAADLAERMEPRYPLLWEIARETWKNALRTFILHDVAALVREGARIIEPEMEVRELLPLGDGGAAIAVRGRFDRVSRGSGGAVVVADYKTAGRIDRHVSLADFLKGTRLQVPLYVMLAERRRDDWGIPDAPVFAEILGVGPAFASGTPPPDASAGAERDGRAARVPLDAAGFDRCREGIEETLRVLVALASKGAFPLRVESPRCRFCPYVRACRRTHAPTVRRIASAPGIAGFLALEGKSTRARTLAEVRLRRGAEEGA